MMFPSKEEYYFKINQQIPSDRIDLVQKEVIIWL